MSALSSTLETHSQTATESNQTQDFSELRSAKDVTNAPTSGTTMTADAGPNIPERIVEYVADPEQTLTIHRLLGVLGALVIIVLVQAAFNLTLYLRRPDTIVGSHGGW